jgi:hypothetical protein
MEFWTPQAILPSKGKHTALHNIETHFAEKTTIGEGEYGVEFVGVGFVNQGLHKLMGRS